MTDREPVSAAAEANSSRQRAGRLLVAAGPSRRIVAPILSLLGLFVLWELVVRIARVPEFLLPAPTTVLTYIGANADLFIPHAWATVWATIVGFSIAVAVGIAISVAIVWSRTFEDAAYPIIVMTQVIPKIALAPLLIIYMGFGIEPKIFLAFLISFFPMVINTTLGMKSVSIELLELLATLRATKWQVLTKVRMLRAIPYMVEGAKVAITLAVIGTIVAEFTAGNSGLGYVIASSAARLQTVQGFAAIVLLIIVGILLFELIHIGGRLLTPWAPHTSLEDRAAAA